jgi:hypothetical protein
VTGTKTLSLTGYCWVRNRRGCFLYPLLAENNSGVRSVILYPKVLHCPCTRSLSFYVYKYIYRLFNFQEQSQNCKMFFFHVFTFYRNQCTSKVDIWSNKKLGILFLNKKVSTCTAAMKILCSKGQANVIFIFRYTFNFYCHSGLKKK